MSVLRTIYERFVDALQTVYEPQSGYESYWTLHQILDVRHDRLLYGRKANGQNCMEDIPLERLIGMDLIMEAMMVVERACQHMGHVISRA
jgi:hypothetical protein